MSTEDELQREWRDNIRTQLAKIDADVEDIKTNVSQWKGANLIAKMNDQDERLRSLELYRAKSIGMLIATTFALNVIFAFVLKLIT